jgi:hypothetical protein
LDELKATAEDLERRKQAHQTKNLDIIKYEKEKRNMLKQANESKNNKSDAEQLKLLKEILCDDKQLSRLIQKSDFTLKAVKNFFKDQEEIEGEEEEENRSNYNDNGSSFLNKVLVI